MRSPTKSALALLILSAMVTACGGASTTGQDRALDSRRGQTSPSYFGGSTSS